MKQLVLLLKHLFDCSQRYSILANDSSDQKKAKYMNKNVVAEISHGRYKNDLLKNKSLRHSINRIQSRNHKIETYEIIKTKIQTKIML